MTIGDPGRIEEEGGRTIRDSENDGEWRGNMFIIRTRADGGELVAGGTKLMWWRGREDKIGIRERQSGRTQKRAMPWEAQKAQSKRMAPGRPSGSPRRQKFLADDGSLPHFLTEICEASHKPLKETYRRSNHIDSIPQIIKEYGRAHTIVVKELEIEAWAVEIPNIKERIKGVLCPKRTNDILIIKEGTKMFMILGGKQSIKEIYNIAHIAKAFMIPDLVRHVKQVLEWNVCQAEADPQLDAE